MNHTEIFERIYADALSAFNANQLTRKVSAPLAESIDTIVKHSESSKAVPTVLITLLVHKIFDPTQDIRYHQKQLPGGFSGRTIDSAYITPLMKKYSFPAMAESGWLTRSLEQSAPYNMDYRGKITPKTLKTAFLTIIDAVQIRNLNPEDCLYDIFLLLIRARDAKNVDLTRPHNLSIASIIRVLGQHFSHNYGSHGASRLPTLALYAAYECMQNEVSRYENKTLCPLESHTSADTRSGQIGDIEVDNGDGTPFEGVEVKHNIPVSTQIIDIAFDKFRSTKVDRYYILTTANMELADWEEIEKAIQKIRNTHGCQVIVNGVYATLKYYLRLLRDPSIFIDHYVDLMKNDSAITFAHKAFWNEIIASGKY